MRISIKKFVIFFLVVLFLPTLALAAPGIPHQFYGNVSFSNGEVSDGLLVEAKIGDVVVGSSVTKDGKYGYNPDLLFATDPDGLNSGKPIGFYVSGIKANEPGIFQTGASTNLNLTVEIIESEPAPSVPPVTPGGGSYTPPAITTPTPLSEAAQVVDTNGDDRVDVLDFNMLVVNWGSTVSDNMADFDNNGTVDVFDFNLLMTYWTG